MAIKKVFRASSLLLRWWLCWVAASVRCPATSPFLVCLVRVTPSSSIVNFSFFSCYNSNGDSNKLISRIFFLIVFKFQMKVWDILHFPWAEATAKLLIQDSFHSRHSILTACFSVDGLILVDKQQLLAVGDHLHLHDQRSAKGSKAVPLP